MDAGLISTCCNSVPDSADQWLSQAYTIWDPDDSLYGCASEVRPPCVHPAVLLTAGAVKRRPPCRRSWYESHCLRDDGVTVCSSADFDTDASGCASWAKVPCSPCTACFAAGCPFVDEAFAPLSPPVASPSPPPLILGNPISPAPPPMDFELINSCCAPLGDAAVEDAWRTLALTPWDPDNNKYGSVAALR